MEGAGAVGGSVDEVDRGGSAVVSMGAGGGLEGVDEEAAGFEGVVAAEGVGVDAEPGLEPAGSTFSFNSPYSFHSSTSSRSCRQLQRVLAVYRAFEIANIHLRPSPS